ncbi:hypothetical protein EXIGLDRAFT_703279 [Exidia glandulosa HHB12029]|uniref:Uncharacterized protein n=1 Tax=Exidia glandulosa HHB12029 TaxID=1314781 RepID=A0A165C4L5_EXIGL|nr:hypothetical protein EXIGLDRAFT_703279 [Exidia glandulosa HHB12029]
MPGGGVFVHHGVCFSATLPPLSLHTGRTRFVAPLSGMQHGSTICERHKDIDALAAALDRAHDALISAKASAEEYQAHEDILAPLIEETVLFFDAVSTRKRFKSFSGRYIQPGRDSVAARRLLEALKAAPVQIQARILERRLVLSQMHIQTIPQVLNDM